MIRSALLLSLCSLTMCLPKAASAAPISDRELDSLGHKIWMNECGGRVDGLTSWNAGEEFASLGIGHFIWYPKGYNGPFDESFPRLAGYLADQGKDVPEWVLEHPCPWSSRSEFLADKDGRRMRQLRDLLAGTVRLQSRFLVRPMEERLTNMLQSAPEAQRDNVKAQFGRMLSSPSGAFALIDYVNFKGEGTKETERYKGQGWGLLQVLAGMKGHGPGAVKEFAASAAAVLTRRVENSPPARGEKRWLLGWKNRVRGYTL
jgi:hypothetical protein